MGQETPIYATFFFFLKKKKLAQSFEETTFLPGWVPELSTSIARHYKQTCFVVEGVSVFQCCPSTVQLARDCLLSVSRPQPLRNGVSDDSSAAARDGKYVVHYSPVPQLGVQPKQRRLQTSFQTSADIP